MQGRNTDRYQWAQPTVEEVADGVFRIPLPMPDDGLRAVNVYAIVGADRLTLVDSGWAVPTSREALTRGLGRLNRGLRDIRQFLVTHLHPDHYAQASLLRPEIGWAISLGEDEKPSLDQMLAAFAGAEGKDPRANALQRAGADELLARQRPFTRRTNMDREWQPPDTWLAGDSLVEAEHRRLRVVPTPGHTRGHVVFHDEGDRLLFSGDHILPLITPSLGLESSSRPWPLRDYMDSLRLILQRPDATLLPAHGPVWDSAHRRAQELLLHHEDRLSASAAAVAAGASTGWAVAQRLDWTYHRLALDELDPGHQAMAVRETMAHLDVLVHLGALRVEAKDGVEQFSTGGGDDRAEPTTRRTSSTPV